VVLPREGLEGQLRGLLEISLMAGEINRDLDRGTVERPRPVFNGQEMDEASFRFFRVQEVDTKLTHLIRRWQEAEARLAASFGPRAG
jgi:hypothetical protein